MKQKKALIIGINYETNSKAKLDGCINDANNMKDFIINKLEYKDKDIVMMTDTQTKSTKSVNIEPTKVNILEQMKTLFSYDKTELFFYYSGHGSNGFDPTELDGKGEMLVSSDIKGITDDEIRALLDNNMPKTSNLYIVMDACNSGTNFDLPYTYVTKVVSKTGENVGNLPYIVKLSSSTDSQFSKEAKIGGIMQGLFTYNFLLEYNSDYTYKEFVDKLDIEINSSFEEDKKQTTLSTSSREKAFNDKLFSKIYEDDNEDDNLPLILGLSLGIGIPVLLVIMYYINYKMKWSIKK